jgi:hypothetical protein
VVGALVIFSFGVLMVMRVGSGITTQMRYAGVRSQLVVLANEVLDSVAAIPLTELSVGTSGDTVSVQGWSYWRSVEVTSVTPVLARVEVTLSTTEGSGPSFAVTSYASSTW